MAQKYKAYVDSSAFIAFLDKSDSYNSLFGRLFSEPEKLLTTSFVISETHGWFLKRYDSRRALQFMNFINALAPHLTIYFGDENLLNESVKIISKFKDQELTITDATGLYLMKSLKITNCWSTDRHLRLLGANLIIHK